MKHRLSPTILLLFLQRRGIAIFIAALIMLSVSILALSTMSSLSETSHRTGSTMESRKLALLADAAISLVMADLTDLFLAASGSPTTMYVNATNSEGGESSLRLFEDRTNVNNPIPLFGYRARATLLLVGDNTTVLPGADFPVKTNNSCYHVVIDVADILPAGVAQSDGGSPPGYSGYFYGPQKSVGITACLKKRHN